MSEINQAEGEPDLYGWIDKETGLPCLITRTEHSKTLCGYVGVPLCHKLSGTHYSKVGFDTCCHGGLTFSGLHQAGYVVKRECYWFGFDCNHLYDGPPNKENEYESTYRNFDYVKSEVEVLALTIIRSSCDDEPIKTKEDPND